MTTFDVLLTFRFPAWDEKQGIPYTGINAARKSDAIRRARRQAADDGHLVGKSVRNYTFRVTKVYDDGQAYPVEGSA